MNTDTAATSDDSVLSLMKRKLASGQLNDPKQQFLGYSHFPDTGREASPAERIDSYLGAPVRQGISELQDAGGPQGDSFGDALKKVAGRFGNDPKGAPTGYDIASKATDNPYLGAGMATAIDLAQAPVPMGLMEEAAAHGLQPGMMAAIKGVKNDGGKIADASEAFKARGLMPPSPDTKIAQMHGQTGEVVDALKDSGSATPDDIGRDGLITRARLDQKNNMKWRSGYDNPMNAPPKPVADAPQKTDSDYGPSRADGHLTNGELSRIDNRITEINKLLDDPHLPEDVNDNLQRELDQHINVLEKSEKIARSKENGNVLKVPEFTGPGKKSAIPSSITDSNAQDTFWHDVNNQQYSDNAKQMMDNMHARGIPEEDIAAAQRGPGSNPNHPYSPDPQRNRFSALPNYETKVTGQIGSPGFSPNSGPNFKEPFPWMDSKYGAGKELLQKHNSLGKPVTINTSSDLIGRDDYLKEIPDGSTVNMYLGPEDETEMRSKFPGNPSNLRLEKAAERLRDAGVNVKLIRYNQQNIRSVPKPTKGD